MKSLFHRLFCVKLFFGLREEKNAPQLICGLLQRTALQNGKRQLTDSTKSGSSLGLSHRPFPNPLQHLHNLRHGRRCEHPQWPQRIDIRIRRLEQSSRFHHPVLRQLLDHQIDELNLVRRRRGAANEIAESLHRCLPVEPHQ